MEVILKDGVKYVRHYFNSESEFEKTVLGQFKSIFGDDAILFGKQKIKTETGIGAVPDAFVILLGKNKWFIIEVELESHDVYQHIIPQMIKFKNALSNIPNRRALTKAFDKTIEEDLNKRADWITATNNANIFRLLSEIIEREPELLIIIDNAKKELENSLSNLPFSARINVFKTFSREQYGFGDNIFLFDTFATAKKIITEKVNKIDFVGKKVSVERKVKERSKASSPSVLEWKKQIPELVNRTDLNSWKDVCDYLEVPVGGDSARRRLKKWVEQNKVNWVPVPDA